MLNVHINEVIIDSAHHSPSISIFHLNHEYSTLLKAVIQTDDVWVVHYGEHLHLWNASALIYWCRERCIEWYTTDLVTVCSWILFQVYVMSNSCIVFLCALLSMYVCSLQQNRIKFVYLYLNTLQARVKYNRQSIIKKVITANIYWLNYYKTFACRGSSLLLTLAISSYMHICTCAGEKCTNYQISDQIGCRYAIFQYTSNRNKCSEDQ